MTRYQACRSIGIDPFSAALITFVHFLAGAPEGEIVILFMTITYDPDQPYEKGMSWTIEE